MDTRRGRYQNHEYAIQAYVFLSVLLATMVPNLSDMQPYRGVQGTSKAHIHGLDHENHLHDRRRGVGSHRDQTRHGHHGLGHGL